MKFETLTGNHAAVFLCTHLNSFIVLGSFYDSLHVSKDNKSKETI